MRIYRCKLCKFMVTDNHDKGIKSAKYKMGEHYELAHKNDIPSDMTGFQYFYYLLTGKDRSSCVICKNETDFNQITMKYSRFCNNPECKKKYREQFKNRMVSKYGKIHLLNEVEKQKEMLSRRKISGVYKWSDNSAEINYTGSYELDFLKLLDFKLKWPSSDIIGPSPHTYYYEFEGRKRFYIPDFFIPSKNLELEIKSSARMEKQNEESERKDLEKIKLMKSCDNLYNYIIIYDRDYREFIELIKEE